MKLIKLVIAAAILAANVSLTGIANAGPTEAIVSDGSGCGCIRPCFIIKK